MLEKLNRTIGFIWSHRLASKNKPKAFSAFLVWQLQTFLFPKKYFKKRFASQLKVFVNKGQTGMTGNLYTGLHEFDDMAFLLHFLRKEDTFIDAGANVGSYTLLASGLVKCKSITFEPVPSTFKNLKKNISINELDYLVSSFNMGLASQKGLLKFSSTNDTTNHVLSNVADYGVDVDVTTLDEATKDVSPALLKIDVEGYETEVLNGAKNLLNNNSLKAIIIELNGSGERYGYNELDIHNKLLLLGFKPAEYNPFKRQLLFKDDFGTANTIYVRDISFVINRLNASPKYRILRTSI